MKKKKIRSKQLLLNPVSRRWHLAHLRFLTSVLTLLLPFGCAYNASPQPEKISFAAPPKVGSWLQSQRELVACDTVLAARYMADFGFFHPQCKQLTKIGPREYQVHSRTHVQLREGPMWLLQVEHQQSLYWVPIPWHDWF